MPLPMPIPTPITVEPVIIGGSLAWDLWVAVAFIAFLALVGTYVHEYLYPGAWA